MSCRLPMGRTDGREQLPDRDLPGGAHLVAVGPVLIRGHQPGRRRQQLVLRQVDLTQHLGHCVVGGQQPGELG